MNFVNSSQFLKGVELMDDMTLPDIANKHMVDIDELLKKKVIVKRKRKFGKRKKKEQKKPFEVKLNKKGDIVMDIM